MKQTNFTNAKIVRRVIQKGTKTVNESLKTSAWNGQDFKDQEEERWTLSGLSDILSAKGTKKIKMNEMRKTLIPKTKGRFITTGKGTSITKM